MQQPRTTRGRSGSTQSTGSTRSSAKSTSPPRSSPGCPRPPTTLTTPPCCCPTTRRSSSWPRSPSTRTSSRSCRNCRGEFYRETSQRRITRSDREVGEKIFHRKSFQAEPEDSDKDSVKEEKENQEHKETESLKGSGPFSLLQAKPDHSFGQVRPSLPHSQVGPLTSS